jgi:hypothetical protein
MNPVLERIKREHNPVLWHARPFKVCADSCWGQILLNPEFAVNHIHVGNHTMRPLGTVPALLEGFGQVGVGSRNVVQYSVFEY